MNLRRALFSAVAAFALCVPSSARADDDDPIPYPGQEQDKRPSKQGLRELPVRSRAPEVDPPDPEPEPGADYDIENMSRTDDPAAGWGAEAVGGLLLLDSSSGGFADVRPGLGLRGLWEFGRMIGGERLRERLFLDVLWLNSGLKGGTKQVESRLGIHLLSLAPALNFPINDTNTFSGYLQLGGGVAYQSSALYVDGTRYSISALKPLIQYGVGLRARPRLSDSSRLRLGVRVELTRFRRDYFDDTFFGVSLGVAY